MNFRHISDCSGVYKIVNLENKKIYIGSAENLRARAHCHFSMLRNAKHFNAHLQAAWSISGAPAFGFDVIEFAPTDLLRDREQFHIDANRSCDPSIGYNRAESVRIVLTKDQRALLATCKPGRAISDETKKKIATTLTGRKIGPFSDEHKRKIGLALKGKPKSDEHRERIKLARAKQESDSLSHPHTEECKAGLSKLAKLRPPCSDEHRRNLSAGIKAAYARRKLAQVGRST